MHPTGFLVFLAALATALATVVIDATDANIDEYLHNGKPTILNVYAHWCGHCNQFAPVYSKLAHEFVDQGVQFVRIDGSENPEITKKLNIKGFPSIFYYDPEKGLEFLKGAPAKAIPKALRHNLGIDDQHRNPNTVPRILTEKNFRSSIADRFSFVLFTRSCGGCKQVLPDFKQLAGDYRFNSDILIAKVDVTRPDSEFLPIAFGISDYPTIMYFAPDDSKDAHSLEHHRYGGPMTYRAMTSFLESKSFSPKSRLAYYYGSAKRSLYLVYLKIKSYVTPFSDKEDL